MKNVIRYTVAASVGAAVTVALAAALPTEKSAPAQDDQMQLPEGWTMEDVMAFVEAGTPGEEHQRLAEEAGVWEGKTKMWMTPDSEPMQSTSTATITPIMDGRYIRAEMDGVMPGMGQYKGFGIYGYDNVTEEYQSIWIDNHSTMILRGTGALSDDGETMTWDYTYTCPLTKKPTSMREVERTTDENTKVMEMHGTDPKTGEEYKMMEITFTRKGEATARAN